ncbi:MAG: DNA recombination protein RmuC [Pseudomonadota bacterium]
MDFTQLTHFELYLLFFLAGVLVTALIAWIVLRAKLNAQRQYVDVQLQASEKLQLERDHQIQKLEARAEQQLVDSENASKRNAELAAALSSTRVELDMTRKDAQEKLQFQQQERERLKIEFENLAQKILDEKSQKFTDQNIQNIGNVLNPLREQLGDFKKRVEDVYDKEAKDRAQLASEVKQLQNLNERISKDAISLTNALKGESKTRGNWGEVVLERILEDAGLREGHEYHREVQHKQEDGSRGRPDVIIHLPDGHDLIVDSKVSLTAYEEAMSLDPGEQRSAALKRHVQALQIHLKGLSDKSYHTLEGVNTLDFVLMFVPIEPALHAAFAESPNIFSQAYEKNIFIVSPTTLLMACRTVQNIWRNDMQNKNALEISRQAGALLDKFSGFYDDLEQVGRHMNKASDVFEDAKKKLGSGRGNLITSVQKLEKLGAKGKKSLPDSSLEES